MSLFGFMCMISDQYFVKNQKCQLLYYQPEVEKWADHFFWSKTKKKQFLERLYLKILHPNFKEFSERYPGYPDHHQPEMEWWSDNEDYPPQKKYKYKYKSKTT